MKISKTELTDIILCYCPSLGGLKMPEFERALSNMVVAHEENGGYYIGLYETAVQYLKSLKRKDLFK